MKAIWLDNTPPKINSFTAKPNEWSAGNGTISFSVQDKESGIASIVLERYSLVTRKWSVVKTWNFSGDKSLINRTYTETSEGVYYYRLTVKDATDNTTTGIINWIYLDHSKPVISGLECTVTDWTNIAPVINVDATDYLIGTTFTGSN